MTRLTEPGPDITPTPAEPGTQAPTAVRTSWLRRARDTLDDRLGLDAIRYPVPAHANRIGYSLGGLTAFALLILIVTGLILGQFYDPDPTAANESVRHIVNDVYLGNFVRGLHFWAAEAMYVLAILHLLRIYFTGSFKRPREGNWLIGVSMLALTIGAMFTGTVLKWDQEGYEALGHNLELSRLLGGFGFWFNSDFNNHIHLLVRLYIAHVSIIPMLIIGLLTLHALLIKRHKISPDPRNPEATGEPLGPFTHHLRRIGALGLVLTGGLGVLAVVFPPGVGPTPVEGVEVTKPPWMYWWMFTLENWVGLKGILWGAGILFALLVAVPFIDRSPRRYWRDRPIAMTAGVLVLGFLTVLTILEAVTTPGEHLGM